MNYAGRINSFVFKGGSVLDAIREYRTMPGLTHLEFNYPEHLEGYDPRDIKAAMGDLKVNGFAIRWRNRFINGNFSNPDEELRREAIEICKKGADLCREFGGSVVTLWFENDGFDYPFQMDYEKSWNYMVEGIRELADYAPDMKISVEYKPYEERNFAMVDSTGMTLLLINDVDRKNVGCTLDFCHMLMKNDSPACGLAMAASRGKLFGLHMNDGYGRTASGMIFNSIHLGLSLEFVYYLKKYGYKGVVFFDTFPIREGAKEETQANIEAFEKLVHLVDITGMDEIEKVISKCDGVSAQKLVLGMLK